MLYKPLVCLQDEDSALTSLGTHTTWDHMVTLLHMELFSEKEAVPCSWNKADAVCDALIKEKSPKVALEE